MILITDCNDVRQKFYLTPKLPVTYEVIDSGIDIKSMISASSFITRGYILRNELKNHIREGRYLYGMSFSINDIDLSPDTIRVFINNSGRIYLGKIDFDKEIIDSILFYISFYIEDLNKSLRNLVLSCINRINHKHFALISIDDIKIKLFTKTIELRFTYEDKRKLHKGLNYVSASKVVGGWTNERFTDVDITSISSMIYAVAKSSQSEYEKYFINSLKEV